MKKTHKPAANGSTITWYAARARNETAKAEVQELKLRKIKGELVELAAVEKAQFVQYRRVRDGLDNIASRIAGLLAAETDQGKCFLIVQREVRQTLEDLSKEFCEKET